MAGYLWGFGQLVNDPSPHLIDALKRHLLKAQQSGPVITETEANTNQNTSSSHTKPSDLNPAPCEIKISEQTLQSKYIQVGSGIIARQRQVSVQCPSIYKKTSRPTSMRQAQRVDRHTATDSRVDKKDAHTDCMVKKICSKHRQVYATLKQWPALEMSINQSKRSNAIGVLKSKLLDMLNAFKLTKIENLPYGCRNNSIRLYRCASIEEINIDEVLTLKCKRCKRNCKTIKSEY